MIFHRSRGLNLFTEALSLLFLLGIHFLCLRYLHKFDFYGEEGPRWLAFWISPIPVLFCYFAFRAFFKPIFSTIVVASLELILSVAHVSKVAIINEALSWGDIFQTPNYSIVFRYINAWHLWFLFALIVISLITFLMERPKAPYPLKVRSTFLALAIILYPAVIFSRLAEGESEAARIFRHHLWKNKIFYFFPDWKKDVKLYGLPFHLAHTSGKRIPPLPSESQLEEFKKLVSKELPKLNRPKTIIYILCESCWHDDTHFSKLFSPLKERGFREFRSISPVYGGSTANAAFEVMTGLPSRTNSLNGVIYQEYASSMGKSAHALPRYLNNLGYSTIAIHNHDKKFWHRNIINPKFGFERFLGLQDMDYRGPVTGWADDSILFDSALKILKEKKDKPLFLYLTTVYTHGPYQEGNDSGVTDYRKRLTRTISQVTKFVDDTLKIDPDALILMFGDHKPSLNDFYIKAGILPSEAFDKVNQWDLIGDVPVYVRSPMKDSVEEL
ncbi:MAG: alkaline phosphatase family protein [Proteobacteria bacterium]|nr:alkaline phosphatase family protein [Pseudomonadota bacterium]